MCLSRVYVDEKAEEHCVMEEADRVEKHGADIKVSTLFGETKHLHGYSIHTVDLMKNYILLKKEEETEHHDHPHEHETDSVTGKLRVLLPHLLDHNRDHVRDIKAWAKRAEQAGHAAVAGKMNEIAGLYEEAGKRFEQAMEELEKDDGSSGS